MNDADFRVRGCKVFFEPAGQVPPAKALEIGEGLEGLWEKIERMILAAVDGGLEGRKYGLDLAPPFQTLDPWASEGGIGVNVFPFHMASIGRKQKENNSCFRGDGIGGREEEMTTEVNVSEDKEEPGSWRVEYFDEDGACFVTIFAGLESEARAREYAAWKYGEK